MKLRKMEFHPVGDAIWLDYDPEAVLGADSKIVLPGNVKMPPFVICGVLAVGPEVKQVRRGERVIVNSGQVMKIVVEREDNYFAKEAMCVAVVREMEFGKVAGGVVDFGSKPDSTN